MRSSGSPERLGNGSTVRCRRRCKSPLRWGSRLRVAQTGQGSNRCRWLDRNGRLVPGDPDQWRH